MLENSKKLTLEEDLGNSFLEKDEFYEYLATPLKPALLWKRQHRQQISESLNLADISKKMENGAQVIRDRLPIMLSNADWNRCEMEFRSH